MTRRFLLLLTVCLLVARPVQAEEHNDSPAVIGAIGWMVTAQGAEFGSTMFLLGRCDGQGDACRLHEGNTLPAYILSKDPTLAAAAHAAISFAVAYVVLKVHVNHPRLATAFGLLSGASFTYIAWHNRAFIQGR